MTITKNKYESKNKVLSSRTWKKMPKDIQDVLAEGEKKFGQEHREAVAADEDDQLAKLKEAGMTVNESPDIEAFKEATRDVYTNFEIQNEWTAELVAKIREAAAQVK